MPKNLDTIGCDTLLLMRRFGHPAKPKQHFTIAEAAQRAGITEALLTLWVQTERFVPSIEVAAIGLPDPSHPLHKVLSRHAKSFEKAFPFTKADIERLRKMVEKASTTLPLDRVWTDDGTLEFFTVAQVASLLNLSEDTIRRLFQDEPGVLAKGDRNLRGKRRRVTLRIPREVMNRVKRRLANK
jgi:AraC-like DNA-binding protein